jgi:hypothetical protein
VVQAVLNAKEQHEPFHVPVPKSGKTFADFVCTRIVACDTAFMLAAWGAFVAGHAATVLVGPLLTLGGEPS